MTCKKIKGAALTGSSYYFQEAVLYKGWSLIVVKELGEKTAGKIGGALSKGTGRGLYGHLPLTAGYGPQKTER